MRSAFVPVVTLLAVLAAATPALAGVHAMAELPSRAGSNDAVVETPEFYFPNGGAPYLAGAVARAPAALGGGARSLVAGLQVGGERVETFTAAQLGGPGPLPGSDGQTAFGAVAVVPEPATWLSGLGLGLLALEAWRRRRVARG